MHQKTRLPSIGLAAGILFLMLALPVITPAQTPALWGDLEPGPFAVGFSTIEKYDFSRTFRPEKDYFGNPLYGESARPIQICYWYPALPDSDNIRMSYGEYAFPYPADASFFGLLSTLQNRELGTLFFFMGNRQPQVQGAMDIEMFAVRDAAAREVPFPLIIYHGGNRSAYSQNAVMCEYLASHGFVVATVHTIGNTAVNTSNEQSDLEAIVRDKEFIYETMREMPLIDADQVILLGYGFGGASAIAHAMRHPEIDALITIQGSFLNAAGADVVREHAFYVPQRLQTPWFQLFTENPEMPVDKSLLDSLRYADRYDCKFPGLSARALSTYRLLAASLIPDSTTTFAAASRGHHITCAHILNFLKAYIEDDNAGWTWLENLLKSPEPDFFVCTRTDAEPVPPTAIEFQNILQAHSIEQAKEVSAKFDLLNPANPILPGATFTQLGYHFLQRGNTPNALELFLMGVTAYPNSANAWDSYGEACVANEDIETALANYRKAFELIPTDTTLNDRFRQLLETNIPATIERLEQQLSEPSGEGEQEN